MTQPEYGILGYPLPENFSPEELRSAWKKLGLEDNALEAASIEVRHELAHPLTLRAWLRDSKGHEKARNKRTK
jgi:hypothetical protein